jgi:hypothetical protein
MDGMDESFALCAKGEVAPLADLGMRALTVACVDDGAAARPNSGSQVALGSSSPVPALASAGQLVLRLRKLGGAQPVALSASAERLRRRVDYFGRLLFSPGAAARCRQTEGGKLRFRRTNATKRLGSLLKDRRT